MFRQIIYYIDQLKIQDRVVEHRFEQIKIQTANKLSLLKILSERTSCPKGW